MIYKIPPLILRDGFVCRACHTKIQTIYNRVTALREMIDINVLQKASTRTAPIVPIPRHDDLPQNAGSPTPRKLSKKRKMCRTPQVLSKRVMKVTPKSQRKSPKKKKLNCEVKVLSRPSKETLLKQLISSQTVSEMATVIMDTAHLREEIILSIRKQVKREVNAYCLVANKTLLRSKSPSDIAQFSWLAVSNELESYMPLVMSVMMTIVQPSEKTTNKSSNHQMAITAFALSVLLKERNQNMSAAQVILSLLLALGRADTVTLRRLQHLNVTISQFHCLELLKKVGENSSDEVVSWIRHHQGFQVVGDNVDGVKRVRRMRIDKKNVDWHWFNATAIKDRIPFPEAMEEHDARACLEAMPSA